MLDRLVMSYLDIASTGVKNAHESAARHASY